MAPVQVVMSATLWVEMTDVKRDFLTVVVMVVGWAVMMGLSSAAELAEKKES